MRTVIESEIECVAAEILERPIDGVQLAGGGGNSRIYQIRSGAGRYALKVYPQLRNDARDRLHVERQALQLFATAGIVDVPRWIGDRPGYSLISWFDGELVGTPTDQELDRAIEFLASISTLHAVSGAAELPEASEACSTGWEITRQIDVRLQKLQALGASEPQLISFLDTELLPAYRAARARAEASYAQNGLDFARKSDHGYALIAADFGFHNVLRNAGNDLCFIDFEYFGWDDPVKLTADFVLHPAMRLTDRQKNQFRVGMQRVYRDDPTFTIRLAALEPLFAVRWSLILLNEFHPERWAGRAFARPEDSWETAKQRQLRKAQAMIAHATPL